MKDFFQSWRRKAGVITLVVACLLCGIWLRSQVVDDKIICTVGGWKYLIHSECGVISWFGWDERARCEFVLPVEIAEELGLPEGLSVHVTSRHPEWQSQPISRVPNSVLVKPERIEFTSGDLLSGFPRNEFLNKEHFEFEQISFVTNSVPIWMLVLVLTSLSSYLILWSPRQLPEVKPNRPDNVEASST